MTHDELTNKLIYFKEMSDIGKQQKALRAVVELHKPKEVFTVYGKKYIICAMCDGFQYPCPTLYVIDEVLG